MSLRHLFPAALMIMAVLPVAAQARDCNEVRDEIDAKIKAKGVLNYSLQIMNGPDVREGQIVGNCELGAKRIVYLKGAAGERPPEPRFASPKQAQPPSLRPALPVTEANR